MSNRKKISDDGWWIVHTIVFPWSVNFLIACTKLNAIDESKPDVGSSQKSNGGSLRIYKKSFFELFDYEKQNWRTSVANVKRRFSPPDKPFTMPVIPIVVFSAFVRLS